MTTKIDELLNGGISNEGVVGRKIGQLFRRALKIASLFLFALVLVAVGQLGQYTRSVDDLRMKTISDWKSENPEKVQLADSFVEKCLKGGSVQKISDRGMEDIPVKVYGVYGCGTEIGVDALVTEIRAADGILKSAAWPLSIIE